MSRCIGSGPSKAKLSAAEQDELQKALAPFEKQAMVAAFVDDASVRGGSGNARHNANFQELAVLSTALWPMHF